MSNRVRIGTSDGEAHYAIGYANEVAKQVFEADGPLIVLKDTDIPSHEFFLNPAEIISIKDN